MKLLEYYKEHSRMSDLGQRRDMLPVLPSNLDEVVKAVQNVLIHQAWVEKYGVLSLPERMLESHLRKIEEKLNFLKSKGFRSIYDRHHDSDKMFAICRDFSLFAVALLREMNIPARARCGFATYFEKERYIDHWVIEYFCDQRKEWIKVDAQIDALQKPYLCEDLNPFDVKGEFISASEAWKRCRAEKADPMKFGIFQWWGYSYLICNLILDANALLKVPMQPWDFWEGYKSKPVEAWEERDFLLMDELAERVLHVDEDFEALKTYVLENQFAVPENMFA